jgi:hypothetical protein
MDALGHRQHHAPVRVLPHIKRLDDCFGDFLVRVVCECGACRDITPQALRLNAPSIHERSLKCPLPGTKLTSIRMPSGSSNRVE